MTRSAARAAYAGSGVSVDVGTPVTVDESIGQDAESDAYAAILSGNRQAKNLNFQADSARRQGAFASSSSSPVGSLLSTAGSVFGIWRGMKEVTRAAVRDVPKARARVGDTLPVDTDVHALVRDPEIDIVVELIGGDTLARELVLEAIANGKHVVTANKALLAKHGNEIFAAASERGVMAL
ncbi:hypothetical protein [Lactiplantibacillus plantarum]|uniref:hypothetical protein n=1 Tax=Lactiplantibacillus plantarum TaxID=1590 RepID=UPI0040463CFE